MATKKPKTEQNAAKKMVCVTSQRGLNFRAGPHQVFRSLRVLKAGELLELVALPTEVDFPGWVLARYGEGDTSMIGWVSSDFIAEA